MEGNNSSVAIKSEPGSKPKFVPKIPVKKEKVATADSKQSLPEKPEIKPQSDKNKNRGKSDFKNNNSGNQRNNFRPNQGGRGAGGRGQWVMPTGTAFFTGNPSAAPVHVAKPGAIINSGAPLFGGRQDGAQRIMRPNEAAYAPTSEVKPEDQNVPGSENIVAQYFAMKKASEDSDSDDVCDEQGPVDKNGLEMWPPSQYDAMNPLSLPLGPKTANMRIMLAAEPILADPDDVEALEKEESSSLFLIQMPSDLKFDTVLESRRTEETIASMSRIGAMNSVQNGKLGKLHLLKSGKVRLMTNSGHSYEVSSGMAASFAQYLSSIHVNDVPETTSADINTTSSTNNANKTATATSSATGRKKTTGDQGNNKTASEPTLDPRRTGTIHFMGNITKKLVITPEYEIGTKKTKVNGANAKNSVKFNLGVGNEDGADEMMYE